MLKYLLIIIKPRKKLATSNNSDADKSHEQYTEMSDDQGSPSDSNYLEMQVHLNNSPF